MTGREGGCDGGARVPSLADVNAVVGGYLRDLAFAQSSEQKMFGYKRAAAAIFALDRPLTDLGGRGDRSAGGARGRYGRNLIRHADNSERPATMSYCGASRCQPMGEPGRYSLMSAIANASASTPAHCATVARSGNRNAGSGPAAPRSYDWPKNATRRRATTPRISKSENATWPMASNRTPSSASVMKCSR
jgi:hypothetical protein